MKVDCIWCALVKIDPRVAKACGDLSCEACRVRLGWPSSARHTGPTPLLDVSWLDPSRVQARA